MKAPWIISYFSLFNFRLRARPILSKVEPDELKAEEYDDYFDERDVDDCSPVLEPKVDIFEEEDYEKNDSAEVEIVEDERESQDVFEDNLCKLRKRRAVSYNVPSEHAEDKEDDSDDDLFKAMKRRRRSGRVPAGCPICKKMLCSKSAQREHMRVSHEPSSNLFSILLVTEHFVTNVLRYDFSRIWGQRRRRGRAGRSSRPSARSSCCPGAFDISDHIAIVGIHQTLLTYHVQ